MLPHFSTSLHPQKPEVKIVLKPYEQREHPSQKAKELHGNNFVCNLYVPYFFFRQAISNMTGRVPLNSEIVTKLFKRKRQTTDVGSAAFY